MNDIEKRLYFRNLANEGSVHWNKYIFSDTIPLIN